MRPMKKIAPFSRGKNRSLHVNPWVERVEVMKVEIVKGSIFMLGVACVLVSVVALAQSDVNPAPSPAASTAPSQTALDESQPSAVTTPTSDAQLEAAGQPLPPRAPDAETEAGMMQPDTEEVSEEAIAMVPEEPGRKRWRIVPLVSAGVVYNDNIFLSNTDRVADFIFTISAGLAFQLGDFREQTENYVEAYWLGIPVWYAENPAQNAFNQSAALSAQYRWNRLTARYEGRFNTDKGPNREVNTITTTTSFSNSLRFQYDYSEKTSFDLRFSQSASLVQEFEDTFQYELKAGMEYQLFPKTRVGLEGVAGVTEQTSEPLQYYQQGRVRLTYVATGKLAFKFSGGVEVREIEGTDIVKINPVFSLGLAYQPFDGTTLDLTFYRNVVAATTLTGQDYTATGFEIGASQRFFQNYIATISLGYENDVYFSTTGESTTDRVDNYVYVRPRLRYSFNEWLSASLFYEFRQTVSNETTSSFYNNRVGMEVATKF
jgi:hypothetical protein